MKVRLPRWEIRILLAGCAMLGGCMEMPMRESAAPAAAAGAEQAYAQGDFDRAAQLFMELADAHSGERAHFRLRAAEAYRENGELDAAAQALDGIRPRRLNEEENLRYHLIEAEVALAQRAPQRALEHLVMSDANVPQPLRLRELELRARAEAAGGDVFGRARTPATAVCTVRGNERTRAALNRWLGGDDRAQNETQLLATLQNLPPETLKQQ